jgi:hypothetical protein
MLSYIFCCSRRPVDLVKPRQSIEQVRAEIQRLQASMDRRAIQIKQLRAEIRAVYRRNNCTVPTEYRPERSRKIKQIELLQEDNNAEQQEMNNYMEMVQAAERQYHRAAQQTLPKDLADVFERSGLLKANIKDDPRWTKVQKEAKAEKEDADEDEESLDDLILTDEEKDVEREYKQQQERRELQQPASPTAEPEEDDDDDAPPRMAIALLRGS